MVDLKTRVAGLELKNPIISAAGPNTKNYLMVKKGIDAGCAAVVVRGLHLKKLGEKPAPIREFWNIYHSGKTFKQGLYSFQSASVNASQVCRQVPLGIGGRALRPSLKEWTKEVKKMVQYAHKYNSFIIASIGWCGDYFSSEDLWKAEATAMIEAGVDALELHTGPCPTIEPGRYIQANVEKYLKYPIKIVKEITDLPLFVKLPVDCCDVISLAQIAQTAGADAVVPAARWMSLNVDVTSCKTPIWPGFMGYGGNWSVPILSAYIYRMRKRKPGTERLSWDSSFYEGKYYRKVTIPIIASGGVTCGDDVVKYILVGANAVEICTHILIEGYSVIQRILREITEWMQRKGYHSLEDFFNIAHLTKSDQMNKNYQPVAVVDENLCNGCGKCIDPCTNKAIDISKQIGKARISTGKCEGCGTCYYICSQGAIILKISKEGVDE